MWPLIWIAAAIALAAGIAPAMRRWMQRRRKYAAALAAYRSAAQADRAAALDRLRDRSENNAIAWFLLGCEHLRAERIQLAARSFGLAYHADCRIESSALLTFACLKASSRTGSDIISMLISTWHEMKRPDIARRALECSLLDCLARTTRDPPAGLTPLGRLAWLTAPPRMQGDMEQGLLHRQTKWQALWSSTPPTDPGPV